MNPVAKTLKRIRWNLLLFFSTALIGAGMLYYSRILLLDAQKIHKQAVTKRAEVQGKLANARKYRASSPTRGTRSRSCWRSFPATKAS